MITVGVPLNIERVNFPLRPIYVGQCSALKVLLGGITDTEATAKFCLTPVSGSTVSAYSSARNADDGLEIYVGGWSFPTAGQTIYEITVTDADGKVQWFGKGALIVFAAATVAEIPTAPVIPDETYIRNPVTGLYHLVSAEVNGLGEVTLSVAQEGIENVP